MYLFSSFFSEEAVVVVGGEGGREGEGAIICYRSKGELRRDERKMIKKVESF